MSESSKNPTLKASLRSYIIGFALSIILTLAAFLAVSEKLLSGSQLVYTIMALALIQATIQLYLFLHLGEESKPYWNLYTFLAMTIILIIVFTGTLWIMSNLNYNLMSGNY